MTLEDGSVIDSRQKIEGVESTDGMRKALATSLLWWQTATSIALPLLQASDQPNPFALILGQRTVMSLKPDGSLKRTRLTGLLPGAFGDVEIVRTPMDDSKLPPEFTQAADLRNYADEAMGYVGYKVSPAPAPWRFLTGAVYYLNHVGPHLKPAVIIDTDESGELLEGAFAAKHVDEHRVFQGATTLILVHTAGSERLATTYVQWISDGQPDPPQSTFPEQSWDPNAPVDPSKYVLPVPIAADFGVTGFIRNGERTDPSNLEAARRLLESRFDLKLGLWDLVDNDTLRRSLLQAAPVPTAPPVAATLPSGTKARAERSAGALQSQRDVAAAAFKRLDKIFAPLRSAGWEPSHRGSFELSIGPKALRWPSDEEPESLVYVRLWVTKKKWSVDAGTTMSNQVSLGDYTTANAAELAAITGVEPSIETNAATLLTGGEGWDRDESEWADLIETLIFASPRWVAAYKSLDDECRRIIQKRGGGFSRVLLGNVPAEVLLGNVPSEEPEPPKRKGWLGRLTGRD